MEGIRRVLVLVFIAGTAIEQVPSVGPFFGLSVLCLCGCGGYCDCDACTFVCVACVYAERV